MLATAALLSAGTTEPYLGPLPVDLSTQGTVLTASSDATIVSQINAQTAGNTVQVAEGAYGALTISKSIGSGFIRIVPAPGATVTFASVDLTNAQGLDFRGIGLTGAGVSAGSRVVYTQSTVRCRWRGGTSYIPATVTCFEFRGGTSDLIVEDLTVVNALDSFYVQGFSETGRPTNITIQRFLSVNVARDHVFLSRGDNITVQDFVMHGHTDTTEHSDGVQIVGAKSSTIRRGRIYNTRAFRQAASDRNDHGIMLNYDPAETPEGRIPEDIVLENLLIHDMTGSGISAAGVLGLTVENCTSYDNGLNGTDYALVLDPDPGNTVNDVTLVNNVFSEQLIDAAVVLTLNDRNFVADGSGPSGTNELTGSPGFTDSANQSYSLAAGSQLIGSGTATGTPTTDLYGTTRSTPPSRGAIEGITPPSASAALSGTGTLSTTSSLSVARAAGLSGSGSLTAAASAPTVTTTAGLSGTGTLSTTQQATATQPAALSGGGTLSAAASAAVARTAALSGTGSLSASPTPGHARTAALSGGGTLTATTLGNANAALSGSGSLTAGTAPGLATTASLSGTGALSTVQQVATSRAAALSGTGALTAATTVTASAAAALSGAGTLLARVVYRIGCWTGTRWAAVATRVWTGTDWDDVRVTVTDD